MKTVSGQTVFDAVLQELGTLEDMRTFLNENGLRADDSFNGNDELKVVGESNDEVVTFYNKKKVTVINGEQIVLNYPGGDYSDDYSDDYS